MRRLSWPSARNERGATMVFVAVTVSALFGFAALGVDLSHTIYERGRIQHAADSAAFAVAYDCVSSDPNRQFECDPGNGQGTVDEFVTAESSAGDGAGAIVPPLSPAEDHVTVEVAQNVSHFFARILTIDSSDIEARATAAWTKHLVAGEVMPYAVSLCHWMQTPYDTDVLLDGGTNATVASAKSEFEAWKKFKNQIEFDPVKPPTWAPCTDGENTPPESVEYDSSGWTLHDGLWFSKGNCSGNLSNGKVSLKLGDKVCGTEQNGNQTSDEAYAPALGEIIPLAVYAPTANWAYGGLCADENTGALGDCPTISGGFTPQFELEIVGFVPFKVLGCHLGGPGGNEYDCDGVEVDGLGLFGQFVTTAEGWNGDFEYGETGNNFGAVKVELVE